jgi:hypothetical protein
MLQIRQGLRHDFVLRELIDSSITVGRTVGSPADEGLSILTACVWLGIVMIKMISNTNRTSINGVMLISE